ncbi:undecaprenyl-diphosphatase [Rhodovulum imhoffii]|uniref:Undecaprenyl-diphosphatase n=1 Tax=Rhodovulum imhoffii TaxID=365340 RepID=A0A2T5BP93_9RHOB|nr:undecaprenyl-diphosphate phosphatase [Rhodovulum imhoffii]MBK5932902.1 undecaprenyl-diphosphatase [Rhodovulum imhoffii]PTN00838.1 undecaprenyl-diphosphatase [Rhodovulum imhoffii]
MALYHLLLVAVLQGITEFLPVSSSGHLILLPHLTGLEDQGQVIDVAVHVGTLGAVILYFRRDAFSALVGLGCLLRGRVDSQEAFLALCLVLATVPVVILGAVLHLTGLDDALRSVTVIGWAMLIFGIVLWWFDLNAPQERIAARWSLRHAALMGLWQALALIPGTSRSGITITGARALGYKREDAAKLAMLMSIPTILASGVLLGADVVVGANAAAARDGALAAVFAFVSALLALAVMMRLARRISFTPYVIYRVILGIALLGIAYS